MNLVKLIVSEVIGLFVDDEFLAIAILVLVAIAAALAYWSPISHLWIGLVILIGCPLVVTASLLRALRR